MATGPAATTGSLIGSLAQMRDRAMLAPAFEHQGHGFHAAVRVGGKSRRRRKPVLGPNSSNGDWFASSLGATTWRF
jgi:hypothetical protein